MSNLTPEDVNLRLTETRNELQLEDTRLWQGLEDERVSRIAGDAANNNLIENTNTALAAQEARLSVEVVQREEGDLRNITSLSELAQALADYRIKTDLELNIERIARQQLGVDLNTRVDAFVATFDHKFLMVYQTIQTYQTSTTASINALDLRVKAYEDMLQDITTDSIQITMDNGEINMGVWTILSQARQWDLEILANIKDYKTQTNLNIDEALQDIQNQLPIEQNIINSALDALSNSQVIQDLDAAINSNVADINTLKDDLLQEVSDRQTDMITFSQNINNHLTTNQAHLVSMVEAETAARVNELQREATIRQQALLNEAAERTAEIDEKLTLEEGERLQQIAELQDGLTQEIQHRIDGDNASITALNNYKVSNDAALANVMQDLSANVTATTANTSAITALDTRLTDNETVAASAVTKAETALTQTTALATQVDSVKASIDGLETELATKVDSTAFSALQADVSTIDGKVTSQGNQITSVSANLSVVDKLTRLTSQGKPLRDDPNFKTGANLTIYGAQTGYTLTRQAITAGNPSGSTHEYRMSMTQAITGNGIGFYPSPSGIASAANKVFLFKMVLKASAGSVINIYKNATGTPSTYEMLGNNLGTGKFETYYFWLECGPTGTFSTAGHVAIAQGTAPIGTASAPFEAIVASYEVWDVTTVNDSIPKEWADKVDASATAITNLQSTVTSQGNQITSTSSAVTVLTNRVTTVENAVSTKAETSTVSALDSKVTTVDGKVTTNTNAITSLSSRVTSVEGSLSNKVDASVLNNYSTTTQMNTAIASGITAYDTSLVIGGDNLASNSDKAVWYPYANSSLAQAEGIVNSTLKTKKAIRVSSTGGTDSIKAVRTVSGLELSANIVMSVKVQNTGTNPILVRCNGVNALKKDPASITLNAGEFKFIEWVGVTRPNYDFIQIIVNSTVINHAISFEASDIKVEYGTKATAWTPSSLDIQSAINANASAITTTQASVTALDGRITSNSNEITTLKNRVTTVEGVVNTKADASALQALDSRVTTVEGTVTTQSSSITKLQNDLAVSAVASDNLLTKSNVVGTYSYGSYPHLVYTGYEDIVIGDTYTLLVCWEHKRGTGGAGDTNSMLAAYVGGGSQQLGNLQGGTAGSGKVVSKFTFVKNSAVSAGHEKTIRFFMINQPTNDKGSIGTVYWAVLVRGSNINTDRWIPSKYDLSADVVANSTAIQTLDSEVNTLEGNVTSNSNAITTLANRVTTAEGNITTTSNALTGLTSRVTAAEGNISTQSNQITSLNNNLTVTTNTANAALPKVTVSNNTYKLFRSVLAYERNTINLAGNIVIQTPITLSSKMFKVTGTGYNYTDGATDINFTVGGYAYNDTNIIRHSSTNTGSIPLRMRLGIRNSTVCIILTNNLAGNLWQYPKLSLDAEIGYTTPPDSWQTGWSAAVVAEADLASYGITGIVEPNLLDMKAEITANASALTALNNTVTQQGNTITSNSNQITSLNNSITTINNTLATKANSSAVSSLDSRVTTAEGNITSLGNQTTTLNATLNGVVDVITIKDTRSTNELPNWYWVNYPQRKVIEFKQASTLGLTGMGTYVSLETTVQFLNATGGSIKQVARSGDELNAQHRYSTGSDTSATWTAWKPYIKDLTDSTTANASAISTLNSQVTSINGTITSQSTAITKLEASSAASNVGGSLTNDYYLTNPDAWKSHYNYSMPIYFKTVTDGKVGNTVFRKDGSVPTSCYQYNRSTVPNNKKYKVSAWIRATSDSTGSSGFNYAYTNDTTPVFTEDVGHGGAGYGSSNFVIPKTNTWTYVEAIFDLTAQAYNQLRFGFFIGHTGSAGRWDLQGFKVEDYTDTANGEANAAAITALDTKVTTIDGKVTTQASSITQLQTTVNGHTSSLAVQGNSINGIQAEYTIKTDVNGLVAGIGLINSGNTSAVGINANYFYVGNSTTGKKPFIVTTSPQTIDGITYPAGTWIHTALIANATIGSAKIASLDATKITSGFIDAARIEAGTITTDKLLVGGGNMLYGGLDNFQNFTSTPPNSTGSGTTTLLTSYGLFGVNRIQHTSSAANSYAYLHPTTSTFAGWVRLRPGKRYILSAYVMTSSSTSTNVILVVQPREGTTTTAAGGAGSATLSMSSADGWKRISVVFTPTGTDPHLSYYIRNVSSGITTYWDGFMLEEVPAGVSAPSPFTLGSMTRIDGGQIVTDSITADKISVTELSAISANLGTFTSTAADGSKQVIKGALTEGFYPSGVRAFRLGVW